MSGTREKLDQLLGILELAEEPAGEAGIAKRKAKEIPSARERVRMLLDKGTFVEIGKLVRQPGSGDAMYGDGVVTGRGYIDGRPVVVIAHDQTVHGGSVGEMFGRKVAAAMEFAYQNACPVIAINDSGGARIQDAVTSLAWYALMCRRQEDLSGYVPQIAVMLGKCAAGSVYGPVNMDVLVATEKSYMFVTGPEVIKAVTGETVSAEELGGAAVQAENGTVHHVAPTEQAAFDWVRDYLSYLPSSCLEQPPVVNPGLEPEITDHDRELDSIIPDSDKVGYDMHEILLRIFDDGQLHEIGAATAGNLITAFARVDGRPIGVIANQPQVLGGALDAQCSDKATHFIRLCDAFGLPLVFVVDTPGVLPGIEEERNGVIKRGGRFFRAVIEATVPIVTVVTRKAYGGGYAVMGCKQLGADVSFAWPTARIAVMGAESMVGIIGRKKLAETPADQREVVRQQMIDFYNATMATPWIAAERGYIDAVIEPSQTRLEIRKALRMLRDKNPRPRHNPRKHSLFPV
ncbi:MULTISPECIES: acyl-CoA carboxylase subunit beta [Nocardia]|uniref:acyl-CoA carboxylase subunit beta n=1 Tax=Nocardia TaxID=1817 RepID=UPI000BF221E9|nr:MULTISPECIES: acyl-CoA carboxylase subunit beta [Nocardia]MBF6141065.1 acyl-CoA carboxylase subunit beta [Nocardia farcinica]MBF6184350.1 acyl-CoA carboxylase subunit beta [Nocardia farcinica]MBF6310194.1 acyl-CoA carboxylase subunit beta [Nocardia farcinica]MBF6359180.1 acyl-CoA carboxylase subunit beta [Nocardia farcinica]MBF6405986.1 acyl-CoA carboxylase subunit beta [Nocardia farcinica]